MTTFIVVDLTQMKRLAGLLIQNDPVELKIIELYSSDVYVGEQSTMELFFDYLLSTKYGRIDKYPYAELEHFFNTKRVLTTYHRFIVALEHLLMLKVGIRYERITYSKIISSDDRLLVEFKVEL